MNIQELEDLTLLLIDDADEPAEWMARWAVSYPGTVETAVSRHHGIASWQAALQTVFEGLSARHIAVVAYGAGVSALMAWLYQTDINTQRRLCNVILVSPLPEALPEDEVHTLQRARCPCRTALIIGASGDCPQPWAQRQAAVWQARLLVSPHIGRLNTAPGGWQWGMKLMQEMLLS